MLHLTKKSNKMVSETTLLEKRIKKVEKSIEHVVVDVNRLKLVVEGNGGPLDGMIPMSNKGSDPTGVTIPDSSLPNIGDLDNGVQDIPLDSLGTIDSPKDINIGQLGGK